MQAGRQAGSYRPPLFPGKAHYTPVTFLAQQTGRELVAQYEQMAISCSPDQPNQVSSSKVGALGSSLADCREGRAVPGHLKDRAQLGHLCGSAVTAPARMSDSIASRASRPLPCDAVGVGGDSGEPNG
jgi:hypothetical protein